MTCVCDAARVSRISARVGIDYSPRNQREVGGRGTIGSTKRDRELLLAEVAYSWVNNFQCPSETTSTAPSTTCMAVWSSIAYAGPEMSAAHFSAVAMVFH